MRKRNNLSFAVIGFILLTIIFLKLEWSNENLGNNYFYLDRFESIDIGYPGGEAIIYKSSQKNVFSNVLLTAYDFKVKHNEKHIIIKQLFKKNTDFNYFIIEKNIDSIWGPMDQQSYLNKKAELNINMDFN